MSNTERFEKFTERARKVLGLAQEEARRFQHDYIGTEHLLLGLIREEEGVGALVLVNLGVDLNKVRSAVEIIIGRGDRIVLGETGLTPRAKKVIEFAVDEARLLSHHSIGTKHLLLGLVRERESIAAGILESLGVNLEKVRTQTIKVIEDERIIQYVLEQAARDMPQASFSGASIYRRTKGDAPDLVVQGKRWYVEVELGETTTMALYRVWELDTGLKAVLVRFF